MNNVWRKLVLVFVLLSIVVSTPASVGSPNIKYGPSQTYNSNGSTKSNLENLKKRAEDLRKLKKELYKKKRKAKGSAAKKKVQKEIEDLSKELKKVFDDHDFESSLHTNPRKPKKKQEAIIWKRQQRHLHIKKLKEKQKKWEEKQKKKKKKARRVSQMRDLGEVTIGDIVSTHNDVMDSQRDDQDVADEMEENQCDIISDDNQEVCYVLNNTRAQTSATLEESRSKFSKLANYLPPVLLGGGIYVLYDRFTDRQDSYTHLREVGRELINCEESCELIENRVDSIKNSILEQEELDKSELDEIQDEVKKDNLSVPVEVELVIPNYLATNEEIPFGNEKELPLIFGVETGTSTEVVKSAYVLVNEKRVNLSYYPETGILAGNYTGFKAKEDFIGAVIIETVDDQVLSKKFVGKINTIKPQVKIDSVPGSLFKKGKFKVSVTGEFDRIEISGVNVKKQTIQFEEMKSKYNMTVKALSKGESSIKVVATRASKRIEAPEFDGEVLNTDIDGRVLRENDFFQSVDLEKAKVSDKDMGFCCDDINEITCEGCYWGKRSRGSCKKLNRLGFNFKAFLRADTKTCESL
tara:strand:+ start:233143 stop:234882 length:1740 start_codon:yes stop_codon:yes gene_type:complete